MTSNNNNSSVVVVGSCMIDFVSYAPRLPKPGETLVGTKFVTNFGGKGANQCVAAAKLGCKTALIARVGNDDWGDKYIKNLETLNVNTKYVKKTSGYSSGIAQITVSDTGENHIVIVGGSNSQLAVPDVEDAEQLIANAAVVIMQLETAIDVALRTCQIAKGITILNASPGLTSYNPDLLSCATIFCVNEVEAAMFTKLPIRDTIDGEAAAKNLISKGCNSVILTLGDMGAVYAKGGETWVIKTPRVSCVDSTGAGDAFLGALAFMLSTQNDIPMIKAIEVACIIAADSVTRCGTQPSFASKDILDKVL